MGEDRVFRYAVMGLLGIQELRKDMGDVKEKLGKLEDKVDALAKDVRDVKVTLENITMTIEEEANELVQYYLRQRGISIATRPEQFDSAYEFDIYGTNGQLTIIGEAKTRVGVDVVRRVVARVGEARSRFPDRFQGRVITVIYALRVSPDAVEEARKLGIWLLESMREVIPFPG
ncbi:hypothetical protein [Vulcanisaeta sp. JCM 14467]|uniref:hypothetical protein n=1 Tax=Vulcanisaeta sp. JCM 14467 TaxID=1295370 RepID=UPI0006D2C4D8|nr:hypothetical protein [Vulcanisaeta sp. JCM 14467]